MAFPTGWTYKCPLTIPASAVPASGTSVPILLTSAAFPASMSGMNADASDLRIASDSNGTVQYPREIISYIASAGILSVYALIPSLSNSTNNVIYAFWGNNAAGEPGAGDPSVSTSVWSNYYGVLHFNKVKSGWKGVSDSSGQWNGCNISGTVNTMSGYAPGTTSLRLSATQGIDVNEFYKFCGADASKYTTDFMFWCNQNGTYQTGNVALGFNAIPFGWQGNGQFGLGWGGITNTAGSLPASGWHHAWMRITNSVGAFYVDGVNVTGNSTIPSAAYNFSTLGYSSASTPTWNMSEFRMTRNSNTPVSTVQIQIASEKNYTTFCYPGTVAVQVAAYNLTLTGLQPGTKVMIYNSATNNWLAGIGTITGNTFTYSYSYTGDFNVNIVIMSLAYQYMMIKNYTCSSSSNTIPVQQVIDRNYQA